MLAAETQADKARTWLRDVHDVVIFDLKKDQCRQSGLVKLPFKHMAVVSYP